MANRRDPEWRNQAAASLLLQHLSGTEIPGPALVIEDPIPDVVDAMGAGGLGVATWDRRAFGGKTGKPWPSSGPFRFVALRLPRGKDELSMSLHAAASVLQPGGLLLVYGAKDEGIQSALSPLGDLFDDVDTVAIGSHCRVLKGIRKSELPGLRSRLAEWRQTGALDHPELPEVWISYPGVFAHGRLDDGTRLLLDSLPRLQKGSRVLDYGCGTGVIGYVVRKMGTELEVELLDVDSVALEAAKENVPESPTHLRDGLPPPDLGPFDAIISNPPFHRGKTEAPEMIESLVRGAPALLRPKGSLVFVAQRRLSLEGALRTSFREVTVLAESPTFRVWMGRRPRKVSGQV